MTLFYDLNQLSPMSSDHDHDHDQSNLHSFTLQADHQYASLSCPISFTPSQAQAANYIEHLQQQQALLHQQQQHHHQQQQQLIDRLVIQGSGDFPVLFPVNTKGPVCDPQALKKELDQPKSSKWMSSKMRIMRKMMGKDGIKATGKPRRNKQALLQDPQRQPSNDPLSDGVVRVCSDCSTTKTPLWRSGPSGPKTLCNACGIRQRKARRALAAAAAVNGALIPKINTPNTDQKDKGLSQDVNPTVVPFKKRSRFSAAAQQKKLCSGFDDIVISLSKSSAFHRVFPQDEKDAAILLMALSCGLMCS